MTGTTEELLAKLIELSGPCPEICDGTFPLGGTGGTQVISIKTGLPVTEYPSPDSYKFKTPESSGTIVFNGLDPGSGGSYVSAPGATIATWLPGSGDYTIEWFQYQTVGGGHPRVFSIGPDTLPLIGVSIEGNKVYKWPGSKNWAIGTTYVNTWVHIALVRDTGVLKCYVNGTEVGTGQADTDVVSGSSRDLYIGADGLTNGDGFPGNITNFRWTNSVVYSGNFTTPSSPLTVLPQTKLLLLGGSLSNPVVDSTGINTLTNFNTTWSADTPF